MMIIDFDKIDKEKFNINPCSISGLGDFVHIVSKKVGVVWTADELHLRSLLCRPDGRVVSAGFPKFFNYGESLADDMITTFGLMENRTTLRNKMDGSLIIRSVIDGKVHFRTRGSAIVADWMFDIVYETISRHYNDLLNPDYGYPDRSLLLEFVSPKTRVIVPYVHADFYALAWSDWSTGKLRIIPYSRAQKPEFQSMTWPIGPMTFDNTECHLNNVASTIKKLNLEEGVVAATTLDDGSIHLLKLKSEWYFRLHAMKSKLLSKKSFRTYCVLRNVRTVHELQQAFLADGLDWELLYLAGEDFAEFSQHREAAEARFKHLDDICDDWTRGLTARKDIAIRLKENCAVHSLSNMFPYMMARALGEEQKTVDIRDAAIAEISVTQLRKLKQDKNSTLHSIAADNGSAVDIIDE